MNESCHTHERVVSRTAEHDRGEVERKLQTRGLRDLDMTLVLKKEPPAVLDISGGGGGGKALVFEKKATTPRVVARESSTGMWWVGSQTSMDAADKLRSQRSER